MRARRFIALALVALFVPVFASAAEKDGKVKTHFAWGADFGASIDLGGDEMTCIDFDVMFGMRRGWIKFLGIGAQADIMVSNSCRSFPLYAELRTNFRNSPSILFWDLKLGASLNYLEHNHHQTGLFGFTGLGVNLARGRSFSSHIVAGYTFRQRRTVVGDEMVHDFKDIHYASIRIGVLF